MGKKIIICIKCHKVFEEAVYPCPECGGIVAKLGHFGTVIRWKGE